MTKYALISHHDAKYQPLADVTWYQNKAEYAKVHNYAMHTKTSDWTSMAPNGGMTGFEKYHIAKDILKSHPEYEWVWWTGTDSIVTNFGTRIEDRIMNSYHFIVAVDVNGINDDSFLARNTPECHKLLSEILSREEEGLKFWDTGQRILSNVLGFPGTGEPNWPRGDDLKVNEEYKNTVKIVPQRYMNSYNYQLYPQYQPPNDKKNQNGNWAIGDWLLHWPAISVADRIYLANLYKNYIIK